MKLIVGLGNPGKEYINTRHNMGFDLIDNYVQERCENVTWNNKFDGLYFQTSINGEKVIFLKPQLYMNLSGVVVKKYVDYFKIKIDDILIFSDDLDLNIGNFKLKDKGSSGGHNGLKDIEKHLQTQNYKRIKIGISKQIKTDVKDYVLGKLSKGEEEVKGQLYNELINIVDDYFIMSFDKLMCKYNKKNK